MKRPEVADLQDALQVCLDRSAILANDADARQELLRALKPERDIQTYDLTTHKLVSIFQEERRLFDPTGRPSGEVDESTAFAINALLHEWGLLDPPTEPVPARYQVEGKVASRTSAGIGGLRIEIVDKGVGGHVQVAETSASVDGDYQAIFSDNDMRRRGKARPDLQARVFAGETFLGASEVRYNASKRETLNVLLDDKASSALRSEHEILTSALADHFTGKLAGLEETDDRQDITYLANKTGWDARAVALAALADQFSARTVRHRRRLPAIAPAFFYALFRAGLPANENALYQIDAKTAAAIWKQAIAAGRDPRRAGGQHSRRRSNISRASLRSAPWMARRLPGVSPLKEMLSVSLGDDAGKQRQFADLYTRHRGDPPQFWERRARRRSARRRRSASSSTGNSPI